MVTEMKVGHGVVEVRVKGSETWKPAQPLLALRAGDVVRARDDAWVIVVLSGDFRSARIDSSSSPWHIPTPAAGVGRSRKIGFLLQETLDHLSGRTKENLAPILVTRSGPGSAIIVTPRNGPVLRGPLLIEWATDPDLRTTIRILGPAGLILEREVTATDRLERSAEALPLRPGWRYHVRLESEGSRIQEVWFEPVDSERAITIRQSMVDMEAAAGVDLPASSLAIIKAAHLARLGLLHDSRLVLLDALARDPREPALHLLLGDLYTSVKLPDLAAESHERARAFLRPLPSGR